MADFNTIKSTLSTPDGIAAIRRELASNLHSDQTTLTKAIAVQFKFIDRRGRLQFNHTRRALMELESEGKKKEEKKAEEKKNDEVKETFKLPAAIGNCVGGRPKGSELANAPMPIVPRDLPEDAKLPELFLPDQEFLAKKRFFDPPLEETQMSYVMT